MTKVIAIGGEPGAGKSSLVRALIKELDLDVFDDKYPLVPYHTDVIGSVCTLGIYEDNGSYVAGTDRMSMAVQPSAVEFVDKVKTNAVIFEGDRLFNSKFLEHCVDNHDTAIYYLRTKQETRNQRYADRGSNQDGVWLAGRETKVQNILTNFNLMPYIKRFDNDTLDDQKKIIQAILDDIK